MVQTLERLTRRTDTMQSIRGIVRTMKTMSAINAAPYEQAARAIDAWRDTVLGGLHAFLHLNGPLAQDTPPDDRSILVVMGSDHGLCGAYNEVLAMEARRHVAPGETVRVLCVGAQMEDALRGEKMAPEVTLLPPANADGLNRLAGELVTRLERMRGDDRVTLIYTQRAAHGRQAPVALPLLPLDEGMLEELAARPWTSRSLPQFSMAAPALLAALVRNLLYATVHRAAAEALMTENAARLARMQQAEQSVDERLEDLRSETRSVRQSEITTELLDVIVGFEALRARNRSEARRVAGAD
ncbi:ATPase [Pikeienuella piscinae]|uniref:ATPase n=1 Tax=Pikeienuella piscinae TaxID=2748098 RepID=A0A7L5BWF9_9RHOB|nr:FoF1 ATP synthase subunit gamma [Pikeienuella piscinae]QIE54214.1 ATPase [Pikeienuella piscinae]